MHLDRLDALTADIARLSTRIEQALAPFHDTSPGWTPSQALDETSPK
jgi:hypothetical protein